MDFGIAKAEGLSMTKAGFALGTPYYMAPEQVLGEQVTEPADVYAFGIMLFEMFTGRQADHRRNGRAAVLPDPERARESRADAAGGRTGGSGSAGLSVHREKEGRPTPEFHAGLR